MPWHISTTVFDDIDFPFTVQNHSDYTIFCASGKYKVLHDSKRPFLYLQNPSKGSKVHLLDGHDPAFNTSDSPSQIDDTLVKGASSSVNLVSF